MSYILDALRRADAQREGAPARGIHAQSMLHSSPHDRPRAGRAWGMAGALIAAVVLAAIAWTLLGPFRTQGVARMAPPAAPVQAPVGAVPPAILPAAIPTPAPATAVMPPAPAAAAPAGNNSARAGEPVAALATRRADGPVPASSTPSAELPLPADGAGMPKLTITGGVYSDAPGQRMLIVNGQVLNEGSEAAPGVVLEQIRPRTAVLGFRGQRYVVNY